MAEGSRSQKEEGCSRLEDWMDGLKDGDNGTGGESQKSNGFRSGGGEGGGEDVQTPKDQGC
jgi:hypothetical protein